MAACLLVLALTVWATRRVLRAGEPTLAVICIALFGLGGFAGVVVAPLGVDVADGVGDGGAGAGGGATPRWPRSARPGVALMVWTPIDLLPKHHELGAAGWRQFAGVSYLWWALATIVAAGATVAVSTATAAAPRASTAPAPVSVS